MHLKKLLWKSLKGIGDFANLKIGVGILERYKNLLENSFLNTKILIYNLGLRY